MTLGPAERERYSRHLLLPEIGAAGKALSAQARLRALNPEIDVVAHELELDAGNALELLRGYDYVIDGSDRLATRYLVNDACVLLARPLVSAAIHRFEGQAMTYVPGSGPCYRCLFPETAEGAVPNCAEAGVLGVLPGMLGALQATEAIKLVLGIGEPLVGRLMTYDALAMQWREFRFSRRTDCAVCGARPSITSLAGHAVAGAAGRKFERIGPQQLVALRATATRDGRRLAIVDVREPREFAAGSLEGSENIPLAELPRRWSGISLEFPVVFVCRSGARSRQACELALAAGIGSPIQLEGGLLAWAALVDPALQVAAVG